MLIISSDPLSDRDQWPNPRGMGDIMTSVLLCLLLSPGLLSTPASSKLGLSSCFRNNVAYDLGQAIASKALGDVTSCQRWCQVRSGQHHT